MLACSFGFRPRRAAHDALQVLVDESWRGRRWVVETDIANCFEAIPHREVDARGTGTRQRPVRAQTAARDAARRGDERRAGPAVGHRHSTGRGRVSPLLANVYLHRIDRAWDVREHGVLVRFADDVVVMCAYPAAGRGRACAAASPVGRAGVGTQGGQDPDRAPGRWGARDSTSSGSTIGWSAAMGDARGKRVTFLARWPTDKAMQHARDRIRELTDRSPAAAAGRGDRRRRQPVPARLGRVLPVRQLRAALRQDHGLRADASGVGHRQATPPQPRLRSFGGVLPHRRTTSG